MMSPLLRVVLFAIGPTIDPELPDSCGLTAAQWAHAGGSETACPTGHSAASFLELSVAGQVALCVLQPLHARWWFRHNCRAVEGLFLSALPGPAEAALRAAFYSVLLHPLEEEEEPSADAGQQPPAAAATKQYLPGGATTIDRSITVGNATSPTLTLFCSAAATAVKERTPGYSALLRSTLLLEREQRHLMPHAPPLCNPVTSLLRKCLPKAAQAAQAARAERVPTDALLGLTSLCSEEGGLRFLRELRRRRDAIAEIAELCCTTHPNDPVPAGFLPLDVWCVGRSGGAPVRCVTGGFADGVLSLASAPPARLTKLLAAARSDMRVLKAAKECVDTPQQRGGGANGARQHGKDRTRARPAAQPTALEMVAELQDSGAVQELLLKQMLQLEQQSRQLAEQSRRLEQQRGQIVQLVATVAALGETRQGPPGEGVDGPARKRARTQQQ